MISVPPDVSAVLESLMILCEELQTSKSVGVFLLAKNRQLSDLSKLDIDPDHYCMASDFSKDYLLVNFLSKWKGLISKGVDLEAVAVASWLDAEVSNKLTNSLFRSLNSCNVQFRYRTVCPILSLAARKISQILGDLPSFCSFTRSCAWSGGSTHDLRRGTSYPRKMTSKLTVTNSAYSYISRVMGHDPLWCESIGVKIDGPCSLLQNNFHIVKGNILQTVPKNSKTDRVICKEPTANIYLQKGIGSIIRSRLKRFGVDLDDQTKNQKLAHQALEKSLCTIDLKSASDTISFELVKTLLPQPWFDLLDDLRSPYTDYLDKSIRLSKFSSMGNGFTFELESLIFFALISAIRSEIGFLDDDISVYGDDIICPSSYRDTVISVFSSIGFTLNLDKTFFAGNFYESCGKHYFNNFDVTPCYQKLRVDSRHEIIRCFNRLFRWSERCGLEIPRTLNFFLIRFKDFNDVRIPRIPWYAPDDSGFLSLRPNLGHYDPNHGYYCDVYRNAPRFRPTIELPSLAYKLSRTNPSTITSANSRGYPVESVLSERYRYSKAYYLP